MGIILCTVTHEIDQVSRKNIGHLNMYQYVLLKIIYIQGVSEMMH